MTSQKPASASADRMHRSRSERGQSLAELAIFAPVIVLVLLMTLDFGRVFLGYVNIENMARIGANYAAINPDGWQGVGDVAKKARYQELMQADYHSAGCTPPNPIAAPNFSGYTFGSTVRVDVTCSFQLLTPFIGSIIGSGNSVPVSAYAVFTVRTGALDSGQTIGGTLPSAAPTSSPPPGPTPTPGGPTPTPDPGATLPPTFPPVTVDFYGTPTSIDSFGGGPTPSPGFENIVGIEPLAVTFTNTTTGTQVACLWDFGDGGTNGTCSSTVSNTYTAKGTYHVTLTVNGQSMTRVGYVTVSCKVPSFSGVRKNNAAGLWTGAGFSGSVTYLPGNGNYQITYQNPAGGIINPPGGCSGATLTVGP